MCPPDYAYLSINCRAAGERAELFAGSWQKVTVFLSSEGGRRSCWGAEEEEEEEDGGVNGWQMFTEAQLCFCDHKMVEGFHHRHQRVPVRNMWWMLLFAVAQTLGSPVSLFGSDPVQMAWVYRTRGPGSSGLRVGLTHHPCCPFLAQPGPSLTASLSPPWDSSALRVRAGGSQVTDNLAQIESELLF